MNISKDNLRRIVLEEYMKEEGLQLEALSQERYEEFMAWIQKKGPRPDWLDDYGTSGKSTPAAPQVPPVDIHGAETEKFPTDNMPQYDDVPDEEGAYDTEQEAEVSSLEDQIAALVQGLPPEEVSDLFQAVFAQIPGIEMGPAEEEPESIYSPGSEGRPTVGFREIKQLIRKVLEEGHYHDMGGEDEMYNVLDPHGFEKMPDVDLIAMAEKDGIEDIIVLDAEDSLANREEVIAALKNV